MTTTARDIDVLARTLWAEARGEGMVGMIAAGWSIRNRVDLDLHNDGKPDWWGESYAGVCQQAWQYSCWNKNDPNYPFLSGAKSIPSGQLALARTAALVVINGEQPDPTSGATHYYATTMPKPPAWAIKATRTLLLGHHVFFKDVP